MSAWREEHVDRAGERVIEENVALARRFIADVLGGRNPNSFDDLVADDIRVLTVLKPGGLIEGKAEYVRVLGETMSGQFTDYELVVEDIVATVDARVIARLRRAATHVSEAFGTPASGRRITMHELHLMRFEHGKLIELLTGGLNPLEFEMLFARAIAEAVFKDG